VRRFPVSAAFVLLAAVVAGCVGIGASVPPGSSAPSAAPPTQSPSPTDSPTPTGSAGPSASAIAHPTGATDLVLRLASDGGFVAPGVLFNRLPQISIYGDGLVVEPGPQIMIYPGPAVPNLQASRLTEAGLQRLLAAAQAAGLLGPDRNLAAHGIADAPTATFTVNAGGAVHRITAEALFETDSTAGLDAETIAARKLLRAFGEQLGNLGALVGAANIAEVGAYRATAIRLFVSSNSVAPPSPSPLVEPPIAWPLSTPLASFGTVLTPATGTGTRCGVVSGADLAIVGPLLDRSNTLTPWTSGGHSWSIVVRPLLPDESGCPS
jgi:hypothetical protein